MATAAKSYEQYRSLQPVGGDEPKDYKMYTSQELAKSHKQSKLISSGVFSLIILITGIMFLLGVLIGYYVNESHHSPCLDLQNITSQKNIDSLHNNVMFYISGDRMIKTVRELTTDNPATDSEWDRRALNKVKSEFQSLDLDSVNVNKYSISVRSPDPSKPNRLQVFDESGDVKFNFSVTQNMNVKNRRAGGNTDEIGPDYLPYVAFSPGGDVQGDLLYGNYGRLSDLLVLKTKKIEISGSVLLLRLGKVSIMEKILNAAEFRAVGVLLYWDPEDLHVKNKQWIPTVSAGGLDLKTASIPAQTISMEIAELLQRRLTGFEPPKTWHGRLKRVYHIGERAASNSSCSVHLTVNVVEKTVHLTNIIGLINGNVEPDRYVMVGASRNSFPESFGDPVSGTAALLELARSVKYVINKEKWYPRRTIKFCSWAGAEFSNAGVLQHIQAYKTILADKMVAYIDLDDMMLGNHSLRMTASPMWTQILYHAAHKVPDPGNPDFNVYGTWLAHFPSRGEFTDGPPIKHYDEPAEEYPFLHRLGVTVARIQYIPKDGVNRRNPPSSLSKDDLLHHFKYHLAALRVTSQVFLSLVDSKVSEFNVANYTSFINKQISHTIMYLEDQRLPDMKSALVSLEASSRDLFNAGHALQTFIQQYLSHRDPLLLRRVNDPILLLDKVFLMASRVRTRQHILYGSELQDEIPAVKNYVESYKLNKTNSSVLDLVWRLRTMLDEATECLRFDT